MNRTKRVSSPSKALLAGAAAGLIASFAMSKFSSLFLSGANPDPDKEDSTVRAASAIFRALFRRNLTPEQKTIAGPAMHYLFGATMAATYSVVLEYGDAGYGNTARLGWGLSFGAAVWLGAHVLTVPALGLSEPITNGAPAVEAVEGAAHLVYGVVVEGVRRPLRKYLS
jgi:putative membrane protein